MAREQKFTIGRSPQCDIVLADESVSRNHAELVFYPDGRMMLLDCNSSLCTFMLSGNGATRRISQEAVADRDNVLFGEMTMPVRELVNAVRHKLVKAAPPPVSPQPKPEVAYEAKWVEAAPQHPAAPTPPPATNEPSATKKPWVSTVVGIIAIGMLVRLAIGISHQVQRDTSVRQQETAVASVQSRQAEQAQAEQQRQEAQQRAAEAERRAAEEEHRRQEEVQRQAEAKAQRIKRIIEDGAKNIVSKGSTIMTIAHPTAEYLDAEFQGVAPSNGGYLLTFDMKYKDTTFTSNIYWLRLEVLIDENGELKDYHYGRDTGYVAPGALSQLAAETLRNALQGN